MWRSPGCRAPVPAENGSWVAHRGGSVPPGSLPSKDGSHSLYAAIIVKKVDQQTREKVGINALLRSIDE